MENADENYPTILVSKIQANASYMLLKQLTSAFLCLYLDNDEGTPAPELFAEAVEMVMPSKHESENKVKCTAETTWLVGLAAFLATNIKHSSLVYVVTLCAAMRLSSITVVSAVCYCRI